jgi:Na+-driven multidrug efflux pump
LFIKLVHKNKLIKFEFRKLQIDKSCLIKIVKIGLPAGVQSAVFNLANIVIQSAINSLGTIVIAASSAALNIEILVYYMLNSFSQACTTFVGQNYGARQINRCKKTLILCIIEDFIASIISIAIIIV